MVKQKYKDPNRGSLVYKRQKSMGKKTAVRTKSKKKSPVIFRFTEDMYYYQLPDHFIDKINNPEEAEIKQSFINSLHTNGFYESRIGDINRLNGICKTDRAILSNLKTQTSNSIILYIEVNGIIKVATTITVEFYTSEDYFLDNLSEDVSNDIYSWKIKALKLLIFCSRERGYGTKMISIIKLVFATSVDDGDMIDGALIIANSTPTSKSFYEHVGFTCSETEADCFYMDSYMRGGMRKSVKSKKAIGKKTRRR
jgi:hypothetical protein